jgi:Ferredoxin thioredoxin reductase variable alpha chain
VTEAVVVYHAPKRKEGFSLAGLEGEVLEDITMFKGQELSVTFPYKVLFKLPREEESGKEVKLIAHLVRTDSTGQHEVHVTKSMCIRPQLPFRLKSSVVAFNRIQVK